MQVEGLSYNIIPTAPYELSLKKKKNIDSTSVYTTDWQCRMGGHILYLNV